MPIHLDREIVKTEQRQEHEEGWTEQCARQDEHGNAHPNTVRRGERIEGASKACDDQQDRDDPGDYSHGKIAAVVSMIGGAVL
jgi:hypothetical protein